jgi:DNA-binding CsgD family transcriptional regulator
MTQKSQANQRVNRGGECYSLTPRELLILQMVINGQTYQSIGYELGITKRTVSNHMRNIRRKLGGRSSFQAVAIAVNLGLVFVKR